MRAATYLKAIISAAILAVSMGANLPALAADPSLAPRDQIEAYINENDRAFRNLLKTYNRKHRMVKSDSGKWNIISHTWKIERLEEDRAYILITYEVGHPTWNNRGFGRFLFEAKWQNGTLTITGHKAQPKKASQGPSMIASSTAKGCIQNYFASRPCPETKRRWTEFAEFHGLALNEQSAVIFQAYSESSVALGDQLMARARGLPEPTGRSVFNVQDEVEAMNLSRYQNPENPCDMNPYGARPCVEAPQLFRQFAARHGLTEDQGSAQMFATYAQGDFRRADVVYALAKGLPVPAYGYLPTGIAKDAAALKASLPPSTFQRKIGCKINAYSTRPCMEAIKLWRDFARRYQLADNAQNAGILEAYTEGDYKQGDQLFAQAKGVSLEQLHEAAGVPSRGLVIEVYPGKRKGKQSEFRVSDAGRS